MSIDQKIAEQLGFPRPHYTSVERERRWLCCEVPRERVRRTEAITDLYVTGARLRLRDARPLDGGPPMLRLTRKADVDMHTRLITSIYLPEDEFALLANSLPGVRIRKLRHRLEPVEGVFMVVDEFLDNLAGLFLAEVEFKTPELLAAFSGPDFAVREVTDDPRYTGGHLATNGIPARDERESLPVFSSPGAAAARPAPMKSKPLVIPGFGPKSTQALAKIGITTIAQVRERDAFDIYAELKRHVPGTSRNFLYGIIAAQEDLDWREVAKTRRTEILLRLDDMGIAPK